MRNQVKYNLFFTLDLADAKKRSTQERRDVCFVDGATDGAVESGEKRVARARGRDGGKTQRGWQRDRAKKVGEVLLINSI